MPSACLHGISIFIVIINGNRIFAPVRQVEHLRPGQQTFGRGISRTISLLTPIGKLRGCRPLDVQKRIVVVIIDREQPPFFLRNRRQYPQRIPHTRPRIITIGTFLDKQFFFTILVQVSGATKRIRLISIQHSGEGIIFGYGPEAFALLIAVLTHDQSISPIVNHLYRFTTGQTLPYAVPPVVVFIEIGILLQKSVAVGIIAGIIHSVHSHRGQYVAQPAVVVINVVSVIIVSLTGHNHSTRFIGETLLPNSVLVGFASNIKSTRHIPPHSLYPIGRNSEKNDLSCRIAPICSSLRVSVPNSSGIFHTDCPAQR